MTCAGAVADWFAYDAGATASAGRQATEYKRDAIAQLREALTLRPAATELSYVLAQVRQMVTSHALCSNARHLCVAQRRACCAIGEQLQAPSRPSWLKWPHLRHHPFRCQHVLIVQRHCRPALESHRVIQLQLLASSCWHFNTLQPHGGSPMRPCTATFLYHQPDSSACLEGYFAVSHLDVNLG